ncbi:MAG: ribosome maturation factor RimM [Thermodesulfobacteriota bacterium]
MDRETQRTGDALLLVGEIVKPHGVGGAVKIFPYSGDPTNICRCRTLILESPAGGEKCTHALRSARHQGVFAIVSLAGIDSRAAAENVIGYPVWAARQELPELAVDEFYWQDLHGLEVVTVSGLSLGRVSGVLATGAHDIMVVTGNGREYLIPAANDFLVHIDRQTKRIVVDPPEGLLDING